MTESAERDLTIVKNIKTYADYPFIKLSRKLLSSFYEAAEKLEGPRLRKIAGRLPKMFECFLAVTGRDFSSVTPRAELRQTAKLFVGALYSDVFFSFTLYTRYEYAKAFESLLDITRRKLRWIPTISVDLRVASRSDESNHLRDSVDVLPLVEDEVRLWRHYHAEDRGGQRTYFPPPSRASSLQQALRGKIAPPGAGVYARPTHGFNPMLQCDD